MKSHRVGNLIQLNGQEFVVEHLSRTRHASAQSERIIARRLYEFAYALVRNIYSWSLHERT